LRPETREGARSDFLYVPPVTAAREESAIIEEVRFARDEDANVVFAIEHTIPNQLGEPTAGFAAHLERSRRAREQRGASEAQTPNTPTDASQAPNDAEPLPKINYLLASSAPANWVPFIPTDARNVLGGAAPRSVMLQRAAMVSTDSAYANSLILGRSRLLASSTETRLDWVAEEAVGRSGVRILLKRQRTRSSNGNTLVWLGNVVAIGRGEARSGLVFDAAQPIEG
jgi:hypothetical protein